MCGVSDDSRTGCRRQSAAVDRIETVPMTAEQYDQAVNALATLIVEWMTALRDQDRTTSGHPDLD
jgi:hypothetical protein